MTDKHTDDAAFDQVSPEQAPDQVGEDLAPEDAAAAEAASEADASLDADEAGADQALAQAEAMAAEHLADLQRIQAEYVNYRRRVDRDREQVAAIAQVRVVEALLPVLDDVHAAREHGDLDGPFGAIADKLEATLAKFGWESFGSAGEVFDPERHEALAMTPGDDIAEPTVTQVAQPGHRLGDRIVRPARVIVAEPK